MRSSSRFVVSALTAVGALSLAQLVTPSIASAGLASQTAALAAVSTGDPGPVVAADGEVPSMRTAQSRTFIGSPGAGVGGKRLSGVGYTTRAYSAPVNYRDADGVWQKIDTTLRPTTEGWSDANAASADVVVPTVLGSALRVGGPSGVGFTLRGAKPVTGTASGSAVRYVSAYAGVDVIQRAVPAGVQELFVLDGPGRQSTFTSDVALPAGATLRPQAGGAVVEKDGAVLGTIPAPVATDAKGVTTTTEATLRVSGSSVTVALAPAWLTDPSRAFPVELDPDFYTYGTSATIKSNAPTTNFSGAGTSICAGWDNTAVSSPTRGLVKFNKIGTVVPPDAEIIQSTLGAHVTTASPAATVAVYPLSRTIDTATVTWNKADAATSWTSAGGDYVTNEGDNPQLVNSLDGTNQYHLWQINPLVIQNWMRNAVGSAGGQTAFMWKVANESVSSKVCMIGSTDPYVAPFLELYWQFRTGMRPAMQYFDHAISDHEAVHVNLGNGNLVVTSRDFSAPAPGIPVSIFRTWNLSHAYQVWQNGYGWYQAPGESGDFSTTPSEVYEQVNGTAFKDPATQGGAPWQPWHLKSYTYTGSVPYGDDKAPPGVKADSTVNNTTGDRTVTARQSGLEDLITTASNGQTAKVTDRNGNVMTINHSGVFSPVNDTYPSTVVDTAGRTWTYNHTTASTGFYTTITGPTVGSSTPTATYTYSGGSSYTGGATDGQLLTATDAAGGQTQYVYDSSRRLTKITSPAGRQVTFTYSIDNFGSPHVASMTLVENTSTGAGKTYTFNLGTWTSTAGGGTHDTVVTDPLGHTTTYTFDVDDQPKKVTDALNHTRSKTYGPDANVTTAVNALGTGIANTTTYSYDSQNRAIGTTDPDTGVSGLSAAASTITYNPSPGTNRAQKWLPKDSTDANGSVSGFGYDTDGNLTSLTSNPGTGAVTKTYTYNPHAPTAATCGGKPGQICTATDGRSNVTRYSYASNGDLTTVTPPSGLPAQTFTYDTLGRTATKTDGKSQVTRYSYDLMNRLTKMQYAGATTCTATDINNKLCITFSYDTDGNQLSMVDDTGTTSWTYDALGRESTRSLPNTTTMTLTYDGAGNLATYTDGSGTTTYGYNNANQLTSLAEPSGSCTSVPTVRCTTFGYDNNGRRTTTTYPTSPSTVMTVTPDNSGRVKRIRTLTGTTVVADFSYEYRRDNCSGGPTKESPLTTKRVDNVAGLTTSYCHDTLDRLTSAVEKNSSNVTTASWAYAYDNAGNRTSATIAGSTVTFGYNNADELTSRNGVSTGFSYDNNGNETGAVGTSTRTAESWNSHDQLTSTTVSGTASTYTYTGLGQGTRLMAGSHSLRNGTIGITKDATPTSTLEFYRDPNGTLIANRQGSPGASNYYVFDGLGSVVALISPTGVKVNNYSYDPYGISRNKTEGILNPWQYTAGYLDDTTGLYKFGARYYDPNLGRFTTRDPSGQEANAYAYVGNSPASFVDPSGLSLISLGESALDLANAITTADDVASIAGDITSVDAEGLLADLSGVAAGLAVSTACEVGVSILAPPTAGTSLIASAGCFVLSEATSQLTESAVSNAL